jgi:hypothetical protein
VEQAVANLHAAGKLTTEVRSVAAQEQEVQQAIRTFDAAMSTDQDVMQLVRVASPEAGTLKQLRTSS